MIKSKKARRDHLFATISDSVLNLFFYDRKEDDDMPPGEIERMIFDGEVTVEEIVDCFRKSVGDGK